MMGTGASFDQATFSCPLDPGAAVDALRAHFSAVDLGLIHYLLSQVDAVERESRRLRRRLEAQGESTQGDETVFDTEA
jgi:hypothetical protein